MVATPTRDHLPPLEIIAIDRGHHPHHAARHHLLGSIGCPVYLLGAGSGMAIRTVKTQGGAHDTHSPHEVIQRDTLQHLHVLEHCVRSVRCRLRRGLWGRKRAAEQPDHHHYGNCHYQSRPALHSYPSVITQRYFFTYFFTSL